MARSVLSGPGLPAATLPGHVEEVVGELSAVLLEGRAGRSAVPSAPGERRGEPCLWDVNPSGAGACRPGPGDRRVWAVGFHRRYPGVAGADVRYGVDAARHAVTDLRDRTPRELGLCGDAAGPSTTGLLRLAARHLDGAVLGPGKSTLDDADLSALRTLVEAAGRLAP